MDETLQNHLNNFIVRFDKDGILPYLSEKDFKGLIKIENTFKNVKGITIHFFNYHYDNYKDDKIILFLPGMGPGHTAYMSEINTLCKEGYNVFTLDYTGCDSSEGDNLISFSQPTSDVNDLLNYLSFDKEIIVIGHSLGGFTALNTLNIRKEIKKGVILSGFVTIKQEFIDTVPPGTNIDKVLEFEASAGGKFYQIDNIEYLKHTSDDILFIHSTDDKIVPFKSSTVYVKENIINSHLSYYIVEGKKHNPNYAIESILYNNEVFSKMYSLSTKEEKVEFMKDKDPKKMTIQDNNVIQAIFNFIK